METTEIKMALERYSKKKWPQTTDGAPSIEELRASDALAQFEELERWIKAQLHEVEEHSNLIRVCSPIVTEEDGSDLIPNWARVQNALMRLVSERDSYKAALKDLYDVASNGMIGDDALCMLNAERLLEDE